MRAQREVVEMETAIPIHSSVGNDRHATDDDYQEAIDNSLDWKRRVHREAILLVGLGYAVLPVKRLGKGFAGMGMNANAASKSPVTINEWFDPDKGRFAGANLGIACGAQHGIGTTCIDADRHGKGDGVAALSDLVASHEPFPDHPWAITPNDGEHHFFEHTIAFSRKLTPIVQTSGRNESGLEVLGGGASEYRSFALVYPSVVKRRDGSLAQYSWQVHPQAAARPPIPKWFVDAFGEQRPTKSARGNENVGADDLNQPVPLDQVQRMLDSIDPNSLPYDEWVRIGMALHANDQSSDSLRLWDEWSRRGDRYRADECTNRWRGFRGGGVTVGTLFHYANKSGWQPDSGDLGVSPLRLAIEKLNQQFAYMVIGGQGRVLRERRDRTPNTPRYDLLYEQTFKGLLQAERFPFGEKQVPLSKLWMDNPNRRVYENGLGLYPTGDVPKGVFNTWAGFAYTPKQGDCGLFLDHISNVICGGDAALADWVLDWLADLVQDPANPKGTAIVMRGTEGCGKGTLANAICKLFGPHAIHLIDESHLTGNFNAHMIDAVVVFADEVTWGGNKKTDGKLKGLVTERRLMAERKGIDAVQYTNHAHLIIASNSEWVIPAGPGSRRWTVIDVPGTHSNDSAYFAPMYKQLENGGYEALLHFLLNRKVTSNLRHAFETQALLEQRALSAKSTSPLFEFIQHFLAKGELPEMSRHEHSDHGLCLIKSEMYSLYKLHCKEQSTKPLGETSFWMRYLKVFPDAKGGQREWPRATVAGQTKVRLVVLQERATMVEQFAEFFGLDTAFIGDSEAAWEVAR